MNLLVHMHPCSKTWECNTPARSGRGQCFTTHRVTVCSVRVVCEPWSNPKGKQWIILNEKWELRICILFTSKYWAERWRSTVQGLPSACPFCIYREHIELFAGFSYTQERKTEEVRASNFSCCSLTTLILAPLKKEGWDWRFLLRISCCHYIITLQLEHFWKPSLLLYVFNAVHLNFQASPRSFCDAH